MPGESLAVSAFQPEAEAYPSTGASRKVLFSAMKNEAPFVLEWIAYHKVIGFDEIVICSNASNDGMEDILDALADAGEIRHLKVVVPSGRSPQITASRAYTDSVGYRAGDWYLWLDADEFLNVHVGDRTVSSLIENLGDRQFALINWRTFGTAGVERFPGRVISTSFVRASLPDFDANLEIKTLFRCSASVRGLGEQCLNRPVLASPSNITVSDVVVGNGSEAVATSNKHRIWLSGANVRGAARVSPGEFGWKLAQINHYIVRTPEFFALKQLRGRGYKANSVGAANTRHTDAFLAEHDRNEDEDRSILHWEAAVTTELARLLGLPRVEAAKQRSDAMVRDLLSAMSHAHPAAVAAQPMSPVQVLPETSETPVPDFRFTFPRHEANLVRQSYAQASEILEYGSGGSTVLAAELGKKITTVESDKDWAECLAGRLADYPRATVHHADIGPTGKWGMPSRPRFHGRFHRYAMAVWDRPDLGDPDLVLIDGRFRAACLATVMLRAKRPTTVLIDDYHNRPYYHGVERLARKEATVGRMARFAVTPGAIPADMLTEVIGWFSDPR
jgi:Glycosyl transferase family 2